MNKNDVSEVIDDTCCITKLESERMEDYWDKNFEANEVQNWVETEAPQIMQWFDSMAIPKTAKILCVGVGDSNIVNSLYSKGYKNIVANDISSKALEKLERSNIGNKGITYLRDDLLDPRGLTELYGSVDIYIDRATLHFFTTCPEKDFYFAQLNKYLTKDGLAMMGVFSKDNKPKCCGLDLQLWSMQSLKNRMPEYTFPDEFEQAFTERNGNVRNYLYLLAKKS